MASEGQSIIFKCGYEFDAIEAMSQLLHSMKNSNMFLCWCHQIIESPNTNVLCLQVVANQSARMLNSSAFVTSMMILDRIFRSVRHSCLK